MLNEPKAAPSPSKSKTKDDTSWSSGWWEFQSLVEKPPRPIQWSSSSVIFTSHSTQPLVVGRLFASTIQFILPSPNPINSSPLSFEPPTNISVSPTEEWLFAYFPSQSEGGGLGCLWMKGAQADSWIVKECWGYATGSEVVTTSWLSPRREWTTDEQGCSSRLPPQGPPTPATNPNLLVVTQNFLLQVCFFRAYVAVPEFIFCSLLRPSATAEINRVLPITDNAIGSSAVKVCVSAAIGVTYNESSIIVATRSQIVPQARTTSQPFGVVDLSLPPELQPGLRASEWDAWGEDSKIELTEVRLGFDGLFLSLFSTPLSPLQLINTSLSNLFFVSTPPPRSPLSPNLPKSPSMQRKQNKLEQERGKLYLVASFLDFGDYSSTPKSDMSVHLIARGSDSLGKLTWTSRHEATRAFRTGVLTFLCPSVWNLSFPCVFAGLVETSGNLPIAKPSPKEIQIGSILVLNIPDLTDRKDWESSPFLSPANKAGRDCKLVVTLDEDFSDIFPKVPIGAAVSPNSVLLCTISSSLWQPQTIIQLLQKKEKLSVLSNAPHKPSPPQTNAIITALKGRRSTADISRLFSLPSMSMQKVVEEIDETLAIAEQHNNGMPGMWTWDILGVLVEIYRSRSKNIPEESLDLQERSKFAQTVCSLAATNMSFEDCREGDGYDLDAVWQIFGLCGWIVEVVGDLLKQCVLSSELNATEPATNQVNSLAPPLDSSNLLFFAHPYALENLKAAVGHVVQFNKYLNSLPTQGEKSQIARDLLQDLVTNSGIALSSFEQALVDVSKEELKATDTEIRRCLALCRPTLAVTENIRKAIRKLTHPSVVDKASLFLTPSDLADELFQMNIGEMSNQDSLDLVSKGMLTKPGLTTVLCTRCGGKTDPDVNIGIASRPWSAWERVWKSRCVCGGLWVGAIKLI